MAVKLCKGCGIYKPTEFFGKNSRSKDGLDWRCKKCKAETARAYIHSEKGERARRAYYENHKSDHMEYKKEKRKIYAEQNPEKVRCRLLLGNAIRKGYIPKPENSRHWYNHWEFHHPDHNRPYYGVWLSPGKHRLVDMGKEECPPCADYTDTVMQYVLRDWGLAALKAKGIEVEG